MQKLAGYKTIIVGTLTIVTALIAAVPTTFQISDPDILRVLLGISGMLMILLRFLTNSPVGKSPPLVIEESGKATEVTAAVATEAASTGDGV